MIITLTKCSLPKSVNSHLFFERLWQEISSLDIARDHVNNASPSATTQTMRKCTTAQVPSFTRLPLMLTNSYRELRPWDRDVFATPTEIVSHAKFSSARTQLQLVEHLQSFPKDPVWLHSLLVVTHMPKKITSQENYKEVNENGISFSLSSTDTLAVCGASMDRFCNWTTVSSDEFTHVELCWRFERVLHFYGIFTYLINQGGELKSNSSGQTFDYAQQCQISCGEKWTVARGASLQ